MFLTVTMYGAKTWPQEGSQEKFEMILLRLFKSSKLLKDLLASSFDSAKNN